jgi:hypothetical protein
MWKCLICGESFDPNIPNCVCAATEDHIICITCFADYVKHCCDEYAVSNKIPIKCFITECPELISEFKLKELLENELVRDRDLWKLYEVTQIKVALESFKEIPLVCSFCNQYAEIVEPANPEYWSQTQAQVQFELEKLISESRDKIQQLADEKFSKRIAKLENQITRLKSQVVQTVGFEEDYKTLLENISRTAFRGEMFDEFIKEELKIESGEMKRDPLDLDQILSGSVQRTVDFIERYGFDFMPDSDWEELKHCYRWVRSCEKRGDDLRKKITESGKALKDLELEKEKFVQKRIRNIQKDFLDDVRGKEVVKALGYTRASFDFESNSPDGKVNDLKTKSNLTSQFFVCKNAKCNGVFCLKCERFLEKMEMRKHICERDAKNELYQSILTILAENGSRKCPTCGYMGRKDLECTQIKCDKCSHSYCYVCGKSDSEIDGGLRNHYNWHIFTQESGNQCPLYLQYKYGSELGADDRMNGDPQIALNKFHEELQRRAIDLKKSKTDPTLWEELMIEKFPNGIFGDEVHVRLHKVNRFSTVDTEKMLASAVTHEIESELEKEKSDRNLNSVENNGEFESKEEIESKTSFHPVDSHGSRNSIVNRISEFLDLRKEPIPKENSNRKSKDCKIQ